MKRSLWSFRSFALAAALIAGSAAGAIAQSYPQQPIKIIIPFAAGGGGDVVGRAVGEQLAEAVGQPIVIENVAGAGGTLGTARAAKSPPDGYTLFVGTPSTHGTNVAVYPKLPYDAIKDFAPISHIVTAPSIAVLHPGVPAKNLQELIALARVKPGAIAWGTSAIGSIGHMSGELLNRLAKVQMTHVPYKGGGQAVIDVLAGQIPMVIIGMTAVTPHVRSGRLRPIATTGAKRSFAFPDVPTVAEQGFPGFAADAWYGLLTTAGTPRPIVDKLYAEVIRIMKLPESKERMANVGFEIVASTPAEFAQLIRDEIPKWTKVVREAGIRAE